MRAQKIKQHPFKLGLLEGTQCKGSAYIINIQMEELLELRSKERAGRGRRPDAAAPKPFKDALLPTVWVSVESGDLYVCMQMSSFTLLSY